MTGPQRVTHSLATGDVATALADRRRALGWSQEEVALRVGVGQAVVCRWERGVMTPHLASLLAWAHVLGCGVVIVAPESEGGSKTRPAAPAHLGGYFQAPKVTA